jgi:hypothetical protein
MKPQVTGLKLGLAGQLRGLHGLAAACGGPKTKRPGQWSHERESAAAGGALGRAAVVGQC